MKRVVPTRAEKLKRKTTIEIYNQSRHFAKRLVGGFTLFS